MKKILIVGSILSLIVIGLLLSSFHSRSFDMTGANAYWEPRGTSVRSICLNEADTKAALASKDFRTQADAINDELNNIAEHIATNVPAPNMSDIMTLAKKYAPNQLGHISDLQDQYLNLQDKISATRRQYESECK